MKEEPSKSQETGAALLGPLQGVRHGTGCDYSAALTHSKNIKKLFLKFTFFTHKVFFLGGTGIYIPYFYFLCAKDLVKGAKGYRLQCWGGRGECSNSLTWFDMRAVVLGCHVPCVSLTEGQRSASFMEPTRLHAPTPPRMNRKNTPLVCLKSTTYFSIIRGP